MGREADERLGKVPGGGDWWQVEVAGPPTKEHESWSLVLKEKAGAGRAGAVREIPPPSCDLF